MIVDESLELAQVAVSPRLVRAWLLQLFAARGLTAPDDLLVVSSELVSNAVVHGQPPITAQLRWSDDLTATIAVHDHGTEPLPELHDGVDPAAEGGRGLAIVDTLSRSWGHQVGTGHLVWATLDAPSPLRS